MMRSSSAFACVVELARRRAVLADARGSPGKRPFSSHAEKKNVQSMNLATSASGTSSSERGGQGTTATAIWWSSQSICSRLARACSYDEQRLLAPRARTSRGFLPARRGSARSNAGLARAEQARHDVDRARRVEHVHDRPAVLRRDLHRRVLPARRRAADEQRHRESRRVISCATNTISSSDGVMSPLRPMMSAFCVDRRLEDLRRRHHHAEVDDLVVVAAEHDADDVLADVVDVALDRRDQHACPASTSPPVRRFSASMYGSR